MKGIATAREFINHCNKENIVGPSKIGHRKGLRLDGLGILLDILRSRGFPIRWISSIELIIKV